MLIPWKSGRLAALVVASALAACGSGSGPGYGDCDPNVGKVGCVELVNAHGGYVEMSGVVVPPSSPGINGGLALGHAGVMVPNTAVGDKNTFTARISGADAGTVTCTVTASSWADVKVDVNPSVVLQPANIGLTCGIW